MKKDWEFPVAATAVPHDDGVKFNQRLSMSARGGRREGAGRKPGVPNKHTAEIRAVASQYGSAIIAKLAEMSGVVPGIPAESETVRVAAMKELLDRGFGRATQPLAGDADAAPLAIDFRWADATPAQSARGPELISDGIAVVFADAC